MMTQMDTLTGWATLGLAIATVGLGAISAWSIVETRRMHRKELKARLLDEVSEWLMDIQRSELDVEVPVSASEPLSVLKYEVNILFKYGILFGKNEYIRAIARTAFKEELRADVDQLIKVLTILFFLKQKSLGIEDPKKSFGGTAVTIMGEFEKTISDPKQVEQLLKATDRNMSECIMNLLTKIATIKARTLSS